jgi:arsenite-transporting ATPase
VNNSLAAARATSRLLRQRAVAEGEQIEALATRYSARYAVISLLAVEPVGVDRLLELTGRQRPFARTVARQEDLRVRTM